MLLYETDSHYLQSNVDIEQHFPLLLRLLRVDEVLQKDSYKQIESIVVLMEGKIITYQKRQ